MIYILHPSIKAYPHLPEQAPTWTAWISWLLVTFIEIFSSKAENLSHNRSFFNLTWARKRWMGFSIVTSPGACEVSEAKWSWELTTIPRLTLRSRDFTISLTNASNSNVTAISYWVESEWMEPVGFIRHGFDNEKYGVIMKTVGTMAHLYNLNKIIPSLEALG